MLSKRRKTINPFLLAVASWPLLSMRRALSHGALLCLIQAYIIQGELNRMVTIGDIHRRLPLAPTSISRFMGQAINIGMAERVGSIGMYNVTEAGEYFLRGLCSEFAKIVNQSRESRWEKPSSNRLFRKSTRWKRNQA